MNTAQPIFFQEPETKAIFREIVNCLPKGTKLYIVGGAMRNAMYYAIFRKKLPQRDYDCVVIGNAEKLIKNLRQSGFAYGEMKRKHQIHLQKRKHSPAKHPLDYVLLEIRWNCEDNIKQNTRNRSNFTINSFVIEIRDLFSGHWRKRVFHLPGAIEDLKRKQLKLNSTRHQANLFACLRFMSLGFKPPSKEEVKRLVEILPKLPKKKRKKNIEKLYSYVGGRKKAEKLARKIGVNLKQVISNLTAS